MLRLLGYDDVSEQAAFFSGGGDKLIVSLYWNSLIHRHAPHQKSLVAVPFAWVLAGSHALAAAAWINPATSPADAFFGPTNLYTFHPDHFLDQWAIMNELDQFKDNARRLPGNENRPDGPMRGPPPRGGNGPGAGPGGNGPMMGPEFKKRAPPRWNFDGQLYGAIRVRFKGNSSFNFARNSLKRSLKLDFNDLEKGRTFFGLTKLNLNNNAMDRPKSGRRWLTTSCATERFRLPAPPLPRVFITVPGKHDKSYAGLYTIVEQVDERFLKNRFGAEDGLLLKPELSPGLPYLGSDWAAYTDRVQPKTHVKAEDSTRFIENGQMAEPG